MKRYFSGTLKHLIRISKIKKMLLEGLTVGEMAQELNVNRRTTSRDMERWKATPDYATWLEQIVQKCLEKRKETEENGKFGKIGKNGNFGNFGRMAKCAKNAKNEGVLHARALLFLVMILSLLYGTFTVLDAEK